MAPRDLAGPSKQGKVAGGAASEAVLANCGLLRDAVGGGAARAEQGESDSRWSQCQCRPAPLARRSDWATLSSTATPAQDVAVLVNSSHLFRQQTLIS